MGFSCIIVVSLVLGSFPPLSGAAREDESKMKEHLEVEIGQSIEENSETTAEDAECFCFSGIDFDDENENAKENWGECAGLTDGDGCDDHCEQDKYAVRLGGEAGTQSVSYCKDDGECNCLDASEGVGDKQQIIYNFKGGTAQMNLAACYAGCNQMCKALEFDHGGCVWPFAA